MCSTPVTSDVTLSVSFLNINLLLSLFRVLTAESLTIKVQKYIRGIQFLNFKLRNFYQVSNAKDRSSRLYIFMKNHENPWQRATL